MSAATPWSPLADGLIWGAPPPPMPEARRLHWAAIAEELKAHPGEWALVATDAHPSLGTRVKEGDVAELVRQRGDGRFEVATRRAASGARRAEGSGYKTDVWMRYVPAEVSA